ncbi:MAG: IPTL-CTERM sorting domain-containing protein [Acidobacteria bacterium]|nr:IPTL-CTERM sorting domain-containing protein [Acidobacteriota bacterium]
MRAFILALSLVLATAAQSAVLVLTVTDNGDAPDSNPGNGTCETAGGGCTLRAAIDESNAFFGDDVINVPAMTIVTTGYQVTGPTSINGTVAGGIPLTVISGGTIKGGALGGLLLSGVRVVGVTGNAIELYGGDNAVGNCFIGSVLPGDAGNTGDGIRSDGPNFVSNVYVSGNGRHGIECLGVGPSSLTNIVAGLRNDGVTPAPNGLSGILVDSNGVAIYGDSGRKCVISGNTAGGIDVRGASVVIRDAYVGTNAAGTAAVGNGQFGIRITGNDAKIGWENLVSTHAGNLVSGNDGPGILANGTSGLRIYGNTIGLDKTLANALPNQGHGIVLEDTIGTVIGQLSTLPAPNQISGNAGDGIHVIGSDTANVQILNNVLARNQAAGIYLGGQSTGTRVGNVAFANGNTITSNLRGIVVEDSSDNILEGNAIDKQFDGILIFGSHATNNRITRNAISNNATGVAIRETAGSTVDGNPIASNLIFDNQLLGIDLQSPNAGADANDALDADAGANQQQNFPLLTCASLANGSISVGGTLNSAPLTTYVVEVFSSAGCAAQGAHPLGTVSVTTDAQGFASFNATFAATPNADTVVTATATDPANNTSEFSPCAPLAASAVSVLSSASVSEGGSQILVVVTKGGSPSPSSVQYTTIDGSATAGQDYTATSGTIAFAACETQKTIAIPVLDDAIDEPNEQFTVHLFNAIGTTIANADETVQIEDDDPTPTISLSLSGSPMAENGGVATVTATASGLSSQPITVNLAFTGTATSGSDYTPSAFSITIPPMQMTGSITLTAIDDVNDEPDETIVVTGAAQSVTAIIADDDEAAIPTLSEWALIALAAMVAAVGAIALRR